MDDQIKNSAEVDNQIFECLNPKDPKSFFLFAGAGSGKTRTLITVLQKAKEKYGLQLRIAKQHVAVITYTRAACEEIEHRMDKDPLFIVSTIHSFVWDLIKYHQHDIREWLRSDLPKKIAELEEQQTKAKSTTTKTYLGRAAELISKKARLESLDIIQRFIYNPDGENNTRDSLNHTEVIKIGADFIHSKPAMQQILTRKYPILLVDESQDTNQKLIEAFFEVQSSNKKHFTVGLFGDTMQRIYLDGKHDLDTCLPTDWLRPAKIINFRCPTRVVTLINNIRSRVPNDNQQQIPRNGQIEGHIRLFIVNRDGVDKLRVESDINSQMQTITDDILWSGEEPSVKTLILEHNMAARRLGFDDLFIPLYKIDSLKTRLLKGTLQELEFFTKQILPLAVAHKTNDKFEIARVIKKYSPMLTAETLKEADNQLDCYKKANEAVGQLLSLWQDNHIPTLKEIVNNIAASGLLQIPRKLEIIAIRATSEQPEEDPEDLVGNTWESLLNCDFEQVERYDNYINERSGFGTHQGVKGLQFARVAVIIDDEEAGGFLFKYNKIFGTEAENTTDIKNKIEGKETSIERTLRLLYVACSRTQKSLAVIVYTNDEEKVKAEVMKLGWFDKDEIISM